jgi:hypothetical protein
VDRLGEDPDRLVLGLVLASTVRRLDEQIVGVGQDRRIADDRRVRAAKVAREDDRRLPLRTTLRDVAGLDPEADDGRAEDVTGIEERGVNSGRDLALLS